MKKYFFLFLFFISSFMLGAYTTSQFKFDTPVESYRWALTSFWGIFFLVIFLKQKNND